MLPLLLLLSQSLTVLPDPIEAGHDKVAWVQKQLAVWNADKLAQYEQPELLQVQSDLDLCVKDDTDDDTFLRDVNTLTDDWHRLVVVDNALQITDVI